MVYWSEFKNVILPWVVAGLLVSLVISDGRRRDKENATQQLRLSQSIEQIHSLLSTNGYMVPPTSPERGSAFGDSGLR